MERDEEPGENMSLLEFDEEPITQKQSINDEDNDFKIEFELIENIENRMGSLLTELQMHRSGIYQNVNMETKIKEHDEKQADLQKTIDFTKMEGERAAAAAEKMVKEYDAVLKKSAIIEAEMQALEQENIAMRKRLKETTKSLEDALMKEQEISTRFENLLITRKHTDGQMQRMNHTITDLQGAVSRFGGDYELFRNELTALRNLEELKMAAEIRQRQSLQDMTLKYQQAIEKQAKLLEQYGKTAVKSVCVVDDTNCLKANNGLEQELMKRIHDEQLVSEDLREALEAATEAQSRLLALRPPPK